MSWFHIYKNEYKSWNGGIYLINSSQENMIYGKTDIKWIASDFALQIHALTYMQM